MHTEVVKMGRFVLIAAFILVCAACAYVKEQSPDTGTTDVPTDTSPDTPLDTVPDTVGDTPEDSVEDVPVDTPLDTPDDTLLDTWDAPLDPDADPADAPLDPDTDPVLDPDADPGTGWGVAVCGTGTVIPDMRSYTDSVTIPALGRVLVMQLDIVIADRVILGIELPFDDLEVSLTSPYSGVSRTFWKNFYSDDTGGLFPDYGFPVTWEIPVWWDTPVGGTWTLDIDDTELTLRTTTLTSWCLTPLDPALHSSAPIHSTLRACAADTGSIPDCDTSVSPPDCPGVGIFEMQIADIVHQNTGSPTLDLTISHSRTRELTVILVSANGYEHTLWDRSTGPMPSTFTLTGMATEWVTGRYQLRVEDHVDGTSGSVTSWCVNAN